MSKNLSNEDEHTRVLYMCSNFWLVGVESRDFSQAEKERTACNAGQIHEMTSIFTQNNNLGPLWVKIIGFEILACTEMNSFFHIIFFIHQHAWNTTTQVTSTTGHGSHLEFWYCHIRLSTVKESNYSTLTLFVLIQISC